MDRKETPISQPALKRASCPACGKVFLVEELQEHMRECPVMAALDEEIPLRGRNLAK